MSPPQKKSLKNTPLNLDVSVAPAPLDRADLSDLLLLLLSPHTWSSHKYSRTDRGGPTVLATWRIGNLQYTKPLGLFSVKYQQHLNLL